MTVESVDAPVPARPDLASPVNTAAATAFTYRQLGATVVAEWLEGITNPNTVDAYRRDLTAFSQWMGARLGHTTLEDVTIADARIYVKDLGEDGFSRKTCSRRVSTMATLFNYLMAAGAVSVNPFNHKLVPRPPSNTPDKPTSWIGEKELMALIDHSLHQGARAALIVQLCSLYGLRSAEVAHLRLGDVHDSHQGCTLRVVRKRGDVEHIDLGQDTCDVLAVWLDERDAVLTETGSDPNAPEGPLLCNLARGRRGTPLTREAVSQQVRRLTRAALGESVGGAHTLRKSVAAWMYDQGYTAKRLMDWGGWKSLKTAQGYIDIAEKRHHPGSGLLERLRASAAEPTSAARAPVGRLRRTTGGEEVSS